MSKPSDKNDQQLVDQFQQVSGDERAEAFETLYQRHEEKLRWYLMRLTKNPALAKDLTQEAFLKAYRALDDFEGRSSFKNWLYQIATNTWRNHLKKKRPESGGVEEDDRIEATTPDTVAEQHERKNKIHEALLSLSETLRSAFVLVRFEGMKYREAAETLGIKLSTLKVRVLRATEQLKEELSDENLFDEYTESSE